MSGPGFLSTPVATPTNTAPVATPAGTAPADKTTSGGEQKNNNTPDYKDFVESVWSPPTDATKEAPNNGQQPTKQQQQQQQAPQQPDVKEQLQKLYRDAGIDQFHFAPEDTAKFTAGDFSPLETAMAAAMQKAYTAALQGSHKMVTAGLAKATDAARAGSKQYVDGLEIRKQLNEALPFTKDPSVGPIAEGIMRQALDRGYKPAQAIAATKAVFSRMFEQVAPVLGENANGNLGDSYVANRGSEPVDFSAILKGQEPK